MVNFVCPGLLGSPSHFSSTYAMPIQRLQGSKCLPSDTKAGKAAEAQLQHVLSSCLLRRCLYGSFCWHGCSWRRLLDCYPACRLSDTHQAHLPPLHSFMLFCKPTAVQVTLV